VRAVPVPVVIPTPLTEKMLGGATRNATYRSRAGRNLCHQELTAKPKLK
jgi:hypothetical protein